MATKRVIAYYMHETEELAAAAQLQNVVHTESYVLGDGDDAQLEALRRQGIVVQELDAPTAAETPGRSFEVYPGVRRSGVDFSRALPPLAAPPVDVIPVDRPTYYLVQLRGPLLEDQRAALLGVGVRLLRYVPRDSYKALLSWPQVAQVQALPFVAGVTLYGSGDSAVLLQPESAALGTGQRDFRTFDIVLQPEAGSAEVIAWLQANNFSIIGAKRRKIRIIAFADEPLLEDLKGLPDVDRVEEFVKPKLFNDVARTLLGVDGNPGPGIGLTGQGQIVAVADTGLDDQHPDFQGRIVGVVALGRPNDSTDPHGHGTHVAGSVLGDGSSSGGQVRGTAPAAQLFFQSLLDANGDLGGLPLDLGDLFDEAYQNGARIHNNSWGAATRSMYTLTSSEVDEFVSTHRDMLIVIAAGNEGTAAAPVSSPAGTVDWLSIGSPASAKNALVVGASRSKRSSANEGFSTLTYGSAWPSEFPAAPIGLEKVSGDPEAMAAFSSRGPCDDRRIKPDLVAPGTDIASTKSSRAPLRNFWGSFPGNPRYAFMGGTSMAAPLVSGCAALVREYFVTARQHDPSAALVKATMINGTRWLTAVDADVQKPKRPNFHQGFGCLHLPTTVPSVMNPAFRLEFRDTWQKPADDFARSGQRFRFKVPVGGGQALRICLAWTDAPGRGVQNSLILLVQHLQSGQKWIANADLPLSILSPDPENNVQLVRVDQPPPGDYLIQIAARNLLKPNQDYALVVAGELTGALGPFP